MPPWVRSALVDNGLVPAETSAIARRDFDDKHPTLMGTSRIVKLHADRYLELDRFGQTVLANPLRRNPRKADTASLTYDPRKNTPGSNRATSDAAASQQTMINRMFGDLNLNRSDVTAKSIFLWRVNKTLGNQGMDAALDVAGIDNLESSAANDRLYDMLFRGMKKPPHNSTQTGVGHGGFNLN